MVQFCYLKRYFGIDIVSRRDLLQWIARIENGLKLRPTTIYLFKKLKLFFFINFIPKIVVQFYYLKIYFGIDIVSRRDLLQWIARIGGNGLKLKPTTTYRTYSNQISTRLIQIMKVTKKVTLKISMRL